jgi:hypothetical protein
LKHLILIVLVAASLGCGKDNFDPVFNNFPLIGTWISSTGTPIMQIKNLDNHGTTEKYIEFIEGSSRFLRRTYNDYPITYEIMYIDQQELKLAERNGGGLLTLYRAKGW